VASLQSLSDRLRAEIGDTARSFVETFTGDGISNRFSLTQAPIKGSTVLIRVGSTDVSSTTVVEEGVGIIQLAAIPSSGSVITVAGVAFRYFTDTEIEYYVNTAFTEHARTTVDTNGNRVSLLTLPAIDEYPLVILASTLALYTLSTDSAFDIDIISPDGVSIPRSERYRQLTEIVQARKEQYRDLCNMLGIGVYRVEMGTLRRVSRLTNKYIPIYLNQEIDDNRRPERVYLGNEIMGHNPIQTNAGLYDISLYQGDSWSGEFDFPFDVTDLIFKAQIRTYPDSPAIYATFGIDLIDGPLGKIRLSLTRDDTARLPVRAFWDLQATNPEDSTFEQTYVRGQVVTAQQITEP
jgi:hypothetical protein